MSKIVSALVAVITAAAAAYTAIKPLLASPTENGIAIAFLVWAVLSTAAHALSDYLPAWVLRVVGDVDGFVADVKKAKPGEAAKAVTKTTLLIVLSFAALTAGCASTPCGKLENAIKYGEQGQAVVNAVCACLSFDATAAQICEAEAAAFAFTDAQAKAAYAQFCTAASDAGMKASPKLRTKEDFDIWFTANGAAKVSK